MGEFTKHAHTAFSMFEFSLLYIVIVASEPYPQSRFRKNRGPGGREPGLWGVLCLNSRALLEHRLQPTTLLTGQGGSAAHCSMYPGGVNLELT